MSDADLNEVKRRTMKEEAFGPTSATVWHYITTEVLTNLLPGEPWLPWLFTPRDVEYRGTERDQERIDRGGCSRWTADDSRWLSNQIGYRVLFYCLAPDPQY